MVAVGVKVESTVGVTEGLSVVVVAVGVAEGSTGIVGTITTSVAVDSGVELGSTTSVTNGSGGISVTAGIGTSVGGGTSVAAGISVGSAVGSSSNEGSTVSCRTRLTFEFREFDCAETGMVPTMLRFDNIILSTTINVVARKIFFFILPLVDFQPFKMNNRYYSIVIFTFNQSSIHHFKTWILSSYFQNHSGMYPGKAFIGQVYFKFSKYCE
jgi:hypothetical protein